VGNSFCPSSETGEDEETDCSTIKPDWDDDKYLTNNDDYGVVARDLINVLKPYHSSESLDPRALLERRGRKTSSLCGISINSNYPGGGEISVSKYSIPPILTTALFHLLTTQFLLQPKGLTTAAAGNRMPQLTASNNSTCAAAMTLARL
jgi:hypothetical protein